MARRARALDSTVHALPWRVAKVESARIDLVCALDIAGFPLSGERHYRLHVPPYVPARRCWAVSVHAASSLLTHSSRVSIDSESPILQRNYDGSVDLYFGATSPRRFATNWAYTTEGEPWIAVFRIYEPEPWLHACMWRLHGIQRHAL